MCEMLFQVYFLYHFLNLELSIESIKKKLSQGYRTGDIGAYDAKESRKGMGKLLDLKMK